MEHSSSLERVSKDTEAKCEMMRARRAYKVLLHRTSMYIIKLDS